MEKSREAFRTISEVSELLDTPAHVLRFWESRFPQVRPVKRAGGRRYYRPTDVALLFGIKQLLHSDGLTIRGVQKVLREQGIRHVMALADGALADGATGGGVAADAPDVPHEIAEPPKADILVLELRAAPVDPTVPAAPEPALPLWSQPDEPAAPPAGNAAEPAAPSTEQALADVWMPTLLRRASASLAGANRVQLSALADRLERLRARYRGAESGGTH